MPRHPARHWRALSLGGAALFLGLGVLVFAVGLLPGDSTFYEGVMARRTPATLPNFVNKSRRRRDPTPGM